MSYSALLSDLCNITRTARTSDGVGGWTTSETTIYRRLACRFNAMGERQMEAYAQRLNTLAGYVVYMEAGPTILEGDIIVRAEDGRTFSVVLVKNYDEKDRFLTIICRETERRVES